MMPAQASKVCFASSSERALRSAEACRVPSNSGSPLTGWIPLPGLNSGQAPCGVTPVPVMVDVSGVTCCADTEYQSPHTGTRSVLPSQAAVPRTDLMTPPASCSQMAFGSWKVRGTDPAPKSGTPLSPPAPAASSPPRPDAPPAPGELEGSSLQPKISLLSSGT